jgi:manganese/iron transport system substrate-binding protein
MSTLENALDKAKIVAVSDGVQTIEFAGEAADNHEGEAEDEHAHEGADPHTWTDPNNVMVWADNISRALSHGDPAHAAAYEANAIAYKKLLGDIDQWVKEQVAQVPEANRKLVTDHAVFGYFAKRYGFEQVGAVIPGFSAMAEPSAQEMAALEDTIHSLGVKAVFTGNTVNPALSQRVADDTGVKLVFIYTDSLSEPNGPVPTYLEWVRHNTQAFVDALK